MLSNPPQRIQQIDEGPVGGTWRVRLPDGKETVARQVRLPEAGALEAAADRLRRLERVTDSSLAPVRAWWREDESVWYAGDADQGESLAAFLATAPLSPQAAAVVSLGLLGGLGVLHAEGLSHGALVTENVRVMPDGRIRLDGHQLSTLRFPSDGELATEVRTAGRLICEAFGIPVEKVPHGPPRAIEHAAPGLVVAARSIATGNLGRDVSLARTNLRDTAGPLAGSERLALGAEQLSDMVARHRTGSERPSEPRFRGLGAGVQTPERPTPGYVPPPEQAASSPSQPQPSSASGEVVRAAAPTPAPAPTVAPAPRRAPPAPRPWGQPVVEDAASTGRARLLIAAAAVIGILALIGGGSWGLQKLSATPAPAPHASPSVKPSVSAAPSTAPSPIPAALPNLGPTANGIITAVEVRQDGSCAIGSVCQLGVTVRFSPNAGGANVPWAFKVFDRCTYALTDAAGRDFTPNADWTRMEVGSTISLPAAKGQLAIFALTTAPAQAYSAPLLIGTNSCA